MGVPTIADDEDEGRGGHRLTAMIDIIFLLLVFFILTTRFIPSEEIIPTLLPTNQGADPRPKMVEELPLAIRILPLDLPVEAGAPDLDRAWRDLAAGGGGDGARIHIGRRHLDVPGFGPEDREVLFAFVGDALARIDTGAARADQEDVQIRCFSGLEWRWALAALDAVRDYDLPRRADEGDARVADFSAPPLRNFHDRQAGQELELLIYGF